MPFPIEIDVERPYEDTFASPQERKKSGCGIHEHCSHYWTAYAVICFWCFIFGILVIFNDEILDPVINFLENLGVDPDNWMHIILFCSATPIIFAPHPVVIVSAYYVCMGFFFSWNALIYAFFTLVWAVCQTWITARYCCCDKRMVQRWFPSYAEEFDAFSAAFSENPMKLGFLISFAPFPSQYNILFPPALSDMKFKTWFPPVLLGQCIVETFDLMVGIQAKTLADAIDPHGKTTEDLIIRIFLLVMIFIALTSLLWYFTKELGSYTQNIRNSAAMREVAIDRSLADIHVDGVEDFSTRGTQYMGSRAVSGHLIGHVEGKHLRIKL